MTVCIAVFYILKSELGSDSSDNNIYPQTQLLSDALITQISTVTALSRVKEASKINAPWSGPTTGPPASLNKLIVYFADDLRNGGILAVAKGVQEAAIAIGWQFKLVDANDTPEGRKRGFVKTRSYNPDGFILGGSDALANLEELIKLQEDKIAIVGWHVAPETGPVTGTPVLANITTKNSEIAQIAAYFAATQTNKKVGAVIFTDSRYQIALDKANTMKEVLESFPHCKVLAYEDVSLTTVDKNMENIVQRLLQTHGESWTHTLAINDLYFDYTSPVMVSNNISPGKISNISAGDGSESAFQRIKADSYQTATVAEPLNLQGWQLIDELNRYFSGVPTSGYTPPVHLVVNHNAI